MCPQIQNEELLRPSLWLTACSPFFSTTVKLHDRFYDKEEKVRTAVVKTVCEVAGENLDALPKTVRKMLVLIWFQ